MCLSSERSHDPSLSDSSSPFFVLQQCLMYFEAVRFLRRLPRRTTRELSTLLYRLLISLITGDDLLPFQCRFDSNHPSISSSISSSPWHLRLHKPLFPNGSLLGLAVAAPAQPPPIPPSGSTMNELIIQDVRLDSESKMKSLLFFVWYFLYLTVNPRCFGMNVLA